MGDQKATYDAFKAMIDAVAAEFKRPSVLYRPTLFADGTMWCALYGEDLQIGVAGFGETPDEAMRAFDRAWVSERTPSVALAPERA